ncbi:MAG: DUF1566 domain-containing protein [Nitrospirae bacterium]|nr:DUF1566 domain-containing protein [Nitrospirota bacterium]
MEKRIVLMSVVVLFLVASMALAGTVQLPQTGQTTCYDSAGVEIVCAGTGQDGDIRAGVAWPEPRFVVTYCNASAPCADQSSDCDADPSTDVMTDNLTGLMWPRNGSLSGGYWNQAIDYANALTLCGYSDWSLPNVNELESLVNLDMPNISNWLNSQGFYNVHSYYYWSSTSHAEYTSYAWIVAMWSGGGLGSDGKDFGDGYYVWPVRSGQGGGSSGYSEIWKTGQTTSYRAGDDGDLERGAAWPDPRFTVNGDCVTDTLTGLMWSRNANLAGLMIWNSALEFANNSTLCGYSDWRLPNRKEHRSLIDYSNFNPVLPDSHPFANVQSSYYWTSSTFVYETNRSWIIAMWSGDVCYGYKGDCNYGVWPVRSGTVDSDNDGVPDSVEGTQDTDGDGISDYLDMDDDNDGIPTIQEDVNGNGNPQDDDTDGDGTLNYLDTDDDGDGYPTSSDCAPLDITINPGATEGPYGNAACSDTADNDCDGDIDTSDSDCFPPDLIVSGLTAPAVACGGSTISIGDSTKDQGTGAADASVTGLYLSKNTALDASDVILGSRTVPSLAAGGTNSGTTTVTIPAGAAVGKYYIIARADSSAAVTESNENNNIKSKMIYAGTDLLITALNAPASAAKGAVITVADTTKNQGGCAAVESTTKFYLSADTTPGAGDRYLGSRTVPALGGGTASSVTVSVTIPSNIPAGAYYIIGAADAGKVVSELSETNNNKTRAITVTP